MRSCNHVMPFPHARYVWRMVKEKVPGASAFDLYEGVCVCVCVCYFQLVLPLLLLLKRRATLNPNPLRGRCINAADEAMRRPRMSVRGSLMSVRTRTLKQI